MSETKALFAQLFRLLIYFIPFNYHMRKKDSFNRKHTTVLRYHYEMTMHYYEKIYRKEWSK